MTDWQQSTPCPQCGSAAAVHSISELADLARLQLNQIQQGYPSGQQQGWMATPQTGSLPGWAQRPQTGPLPGPRSGRTRNLGNNPYDGGIDQAAADAALGAAARFIGRAVGRRAQRPYSERVMPSLTARAEEMLREHIAIAERHPDLRACLTDKVIFLAGGNRVLPLPSLQGALTVQRSDALVAQLRQG